MIFIEKDPWEPYIAVTEARPVYRMLTFVLQALAL